jgi:hypothetical protein
MATTNTSKYIKKFYCEICDFKCCKKGDYNRHVLTPKHVLATDGNNDAIIQVKKTSHVCDNCNKEYVDRTGLWRHKKRCFMIQGETESKSTNNIPENNMDLEKKAELFKHMLTQNQDFMTDIVEKVMPNIGMNNSHNTNTNSLNTNNFNIQMFLNEHCKNAMNLTDFIQSLPITHETYDSTIENGLTKTITSMMVNGLNELDILERPIHCTDASRKTLYVKDSDKWEKDNELLHIVSGIKCLSYKQRTKLNRWQEANDGWRTTDRLQSRMTRLVCNSMTQIESDERETSKIIRSISKNVYLDNETKKCYT